jgi:NADH-quinone oxidoreductase subunit N
MSAADVYSLAPYLVLGSALLVLMMTVTFTRSHRVAMWITVARITAALFTAAWVSDAPQRTILHLLQMDGFAAYFNILFLLAAGVTSLLAYHYLQGRRGELEEFYLLVVTATLGAMVMAAASHFATFVLGLEILSISLYALVAYTEEEHPPLEAALKYLVLSAVASIMVLFGMALIYNATGSMSFDAISSPANARLEIHLRVGQALMFTGLAIVLIGSFPAPLIDSVSTLVADFNR